MPGATIRVELLYALPERQDFVALELPASATVRDAVTACRAAGRLPAGLPEDPPMARYGHRVGPDTPLADGDRLDILRPLTADPKEARRQRAARQATKKR